eukprot:gb/GECH01014491.1/.p1 GENE.gb/GECH01014491.1/~~gb/GECH01014491.1/.p1  ORF type:complete len:1608 (+),score=341.42 gb/GECH01014491.1/:1-4824(+)
MLRQRQPNRLLFFLLASILFLITIDHVKFSKAQCDQSSPPSSGSTPFIEGRNLCGVDGPPSMILTINYNRQPTTYSAVVENGNGEVIYSTEDRSYSSNSFTVSDITPETTYELTLEVSNCFGTTTNQFTIQSPSPQVPPSSFTYGMSGCEFDGTPLLYVDVFDMLGSGSTETFIDICVGTEIDSCNIASTHNITSTGESFFEYSGEYERIYWIQATAVTCVDTTISSVNFTQPIPQGPSLTSEARIENRDSLDFSTKCTGYLLLDTEGINGPSWDSMAGNYTACYYPVNNEGVNQCKEIPVGNFEIENLELDTAYFVEVTVSDSCTDSSVSVNSTLQTNSKSSETISTSSAFVEEISLLSPDTETCSGITEISWSNFVYPSDTQIEFRAGFDICVTDLNSDIQCDVLETTIYDTTSLQVNVTLGKTLNYTIIPNNCGIINDNGIHEIYSVPPTSVPSTLEGAEINFESQLSSYLESECLTFVNIDWTSFLGNPSEYSICISEQASDCNQVKNFQSITENSYETTLSPGVNYYFSVQARNCKGKSIDSINQYYTVPDVPPPTLHQRPFDLENLSPKILITPNCENSREVTMEFRGWNGFIDHYEVCIDETDCSYTNETSFVYSFPQASQEYDITVSAGNCKGKSPLSTKYQLESETPSPNAENLYFLFDANHDNSCFYNLKTGIENFSNVQNFSYCLSTQDCELDQITSESIIDKTAPDGTYNMKVMANGCESKSTTQEDYINLYPISKPSFVQNISLNVAPSTSTICDGFLLSFDIPKAVDQNGIWFTGSYSVCISEQECSEASFRNLNTEDGFSFSQFVSSGTYNVNVRATNCAGSSILSEQITIQEPQLPSISDVYLHYKLKFLEGGCKRQIGFYWNDIASDAIYRYCFAPKNSFETTCSQIFTWKQIKGNTFVSEIMDVSSSNVSYVFALVAENCVGVSDREQIEAFIPQASLEETPIEMSDSYLDINYQSLRDEGGNCGVSVILNTGGMKQFGQPYSGSYQFCLGDELGDCRIDEQTSTSSSVNFFIPSSQLGNETFASVTPIRPCLSTNEEHLIKSFIPSLQPKEIDFDISSTFGCDGYRYITANWNEIPFAFDSFTLDLLFSNGTLVQHSEIDVNSLEHVFLDHAIYQGEEYTVKFVLSQCGSNVMETISDPFTVPEPTPLDGSNSIFNSTTYSDSQCNVFISLGTAGFEGLSSYSGEKEFCVGRSSPDQCSTSVGQSPSNSFQISRYLLGRDYYSTAYVSNCPSDTITTNTEKLNVPVPSEINTDNARLKVTPRQTMFCEATLSVEASGFMVNGINYGGDYMYCVGSTPENCDVVSWQRSEGNQEWNIQFPVLEQREYYVTAYGYNCLGSSSYVSSSAIVLSSEYGCCASPLRSSSDQDPSLLVIQTLCSDGNPSPTLSLTNVQGIATNLEVCVGSQKGQCDIEPFKSKSVDKLDRFTVDLTKINSENDVWLSLKASNCRSNLDTISKQLFGRPFISGSLGLEQDGCQIKGSVSDVSESDGYRFCVGSSEGDCDLISFQDVSSSGRISISADELGSRSTFYFQVVGQNCYGTSPPLRESFSFDSDQCNGEASAASSNFVLPSTLYLTVILSLLLLFILIQ